jgi:hypothetical protein
MLVLLILLLRSFEILQSARENEAVHRRGAVASFQINERKVV